jgi:hypothetical protein
MPHPRLRRPQWLAASLAAIPAAALTVGIPFANRVDLTLFEMPFLVSWIVGWILLTPLFLFAVYRVEGRST